MITLKTLINNGKVDINLQDRRINLQVVPYIIKNYENEKNKTPKDKFLKFIENNIEVISGFSKDEHTVEIDLYSFVLKNFDTLEKLFKEEVKISNYIKSDGLGTIDITDKMLTMIAGFGTEKFYEDFNNCFNKEIDLSKNYNDRLNNKDDFKKLVLLQNRILDLDVTNGDSVILLDEIDQKLNKQIVDLMEKGNISYEEYKRINQKAQEQLKEEKYYEILAEDRINNLFEDCTTKEIVETLYSLDLDREYIVNQFIDIERIRKANKILNELEEITETLVYSKDNGNGEILYVTKEDLEMIYGKDEIENLQQEKLEILSENLIDKYEKSDKYREYVFEDNFKSFLLSYEAENGDLEELEEDEEEDEL